MKVRVLLLALALLPVASATWASDEEPTRDEVLKALEEWGEGEPAERGEVRIRLWGSAALPHLRAIASDRSGRRHALYLVRAIRAVGTREAVDLYVEILEGRTRAPADAAVANL